MVVDNTLFTGPAIILGIFTGCLVIVSVIAVIRSQRRKPAAGRETIIGQTAVAQTTLNPEGTVLLEGELWRATAGNARIEAGTKVTVVSISGLTVSVKVKEVSDD